MLWGTTASLAAAAAFAVVAAGCSSVVLTEAVREFERPAEITDVNGQ